MTPEAFERICLALLQTEMVIQWGGSHVFKVAGKVFAIGGFDDPPGCSIKTPELTFEMLLESGLGRRAPYLPRGGWVSLRLDALDDADLETYLRGSYRLVAPKKLGALV